MRVKLILKARLVAGVVSGGPACLSLGAWGRLCIPQEGRGEREPGEEWGVSQRPGLAPAGGGGVGMAIRGPTSGLAWMGGGERGRGVLEKA